MPTAGQLLLNELLPARYRDYNRVLDKKGLKKLLQDVAQNDPDIYSEVVGKLGRFGAQAAQRSGGYGLASDLLQTPEITRKYRDKLRTQLRSIYDNDNLSSAEKDEKVTELILNQGAKFRPALKEALLAEGHPSALLIASGAKGNDFALSAGLGYDGLYVDASDKPVPFPVLHNYSEGLNPFEYWAGAHGARRGVIDPKLGTAQSGFLCLAAGTLVRMGDFSVKRIEDIQVGDEVLGVAEGCHGVPVRVVNTFDNGVKECWRTCFTTGTEKDTERYLESTLDHKVYSELRGQHAVYVETSDGRRRKTQTITYATAAHPVGVKGNFGALPLRSVYDFSGISEPFAYLVGLLIGDGCMTNTKNCRSIELTKPDPVLLASLPAYLETIGVRMQIKDMAQGRCVFRDAISQSKNYKRKANGQIISEVVNTLKIKLKELGLLGKYSHEKTMPTAVYEWDKKSIAELIGGYFDTDGSIFQCKGARQQPMIDFGSVSPQLLHQLKELLETRFGIMCSRIYSTDCNVRKKAGRVAYNLTIARRQDVQQFYKEIPIRGVKKQKFDELAATFFSEDYVVKARDKRKFYRQSQTLLGDRQTYDIEVASDNHLFVLANGLIVSNSKQIVTITHRGVVSGSDVPDGKFRENVGLPASTDDSECIGSYLAASVGGYRRNTLITDAVLRDLQRQKVTDMLVRSPIVSGPGDGSLYAYDIGLGEHGRNYVAGENPSVTAGQSLSEVITQSMLSSKHTGGVAGGTAKAVSGFKTINQMLQSPSHWEGAVHAQEDGKVTSVKADELGNQVVTINGKEHIVPHTNKVTVKAGDMIEAGDVVSDGLPNPAEIVRHQGIGQGRVTYVQALRKAMSAGGVNTSRRNLELVAKGLIDHIHIDSEHGDYLPGDIVPYSKYEAEYVPREHAAKGRPEHLLGQYLEEPVLHYTIGTKIRPSVLANLKKFGIKQVAAHKEPPRFQSQFVRAMANASVSNDWLTRMGGSYQKRSIIEAAQRGMTSDPFGPSYIPAVVGRTDFTKAKPGQPNPIIKSVLPNLPQKEIVRPEYEMDESTKLWFEKDGD